MVGTTNVKGYTRVTFLCGNRASSYFTSMAQREQTITSTLGAAPRVHADKVAMLIKNQQALNRQCANLQKDIGRLDALSELSNMVCL